jgi:hypothetical protein
VIPLPITITARARARADLDEARSWYEAIRAELAEQFSDDVDLVMSMSAERPRSFPEVEEGVRRALCKTFPYKVYFVVSADEVIT